MQLKRAIISFSLLFVYALGFSHSLVPHCHDGEGSEHASEHVHQHEHHHHNDLGSVEHEHVSHKDHFDDGILDMIICALSETDHSFPDNSECFFLPEAPSYKSSDTTSKLQTLSLLFALCFKRSNHQQDVEFSPVCSIAYTPPALYVSSQRGPPIVS